jgi:flagellar biosynthesis anti-sigma factor FlgM
VSTRIKGPEGGVVENAGRSRTVVRPASVGGARDTAAPQAVSDSGSVHITSAAHQLLALQQAIGEVPDIDSSRVQRLRAEIDQNRYQIDAGSIADRLVQLESQLEESIAVNGAARDIGP